MTTSTGDTILTKADYAELTSIELIGSYVDEVEMIEALINSEPPAESELYSEWIVDFNTHQDNLKVLQSSIKRKVQNVDKFLVNIQKREYLLDAEIEHLKTEQARIVKRKNALQSTKKYFNDYLLPMFVKSLGKDGKWETDIARYTLYETYGSVMVDPDLVSDDFKKVVIKESVDKVKARKAAMSAHKNGDTMPPGISILRVEKVRRS